ncbi:hypothetical protein B0A48_13072 [Cryoendolithus antarcticus]|uniref:NADH:ubiquinone oxidoreductase intermediate-associated protein 30 domain-containing protein n=1 Tax=Cryoendolithus antarcticus TaxID=1507870 RepID=A0A1V8SNX3_9PEZI|nr:hypothetical protein B0A48_13072 [Cryoendolithus antarcticus]
MRAITLFAVLYAATTVWAEPNPCDESKGHKRQCFISTFEDVLATGTNPNALVEHKGLSYINWRHIDLSDKAKLGIELASPPHAIRGIMGETRISSPAGMKFAMYNRIQAGDDTEHFQLQELSFACLNVSRVCHLVVSGYVDNGTAIHKEGEWFNGIGQRKTPMTRMTFPANFSELAGIQLTISNFGQRTPDPLLLLDDIHYCICDGVTPQTIALRGGLAKKELDLGIDWENMRQDRIEAFAAHVHQPGQQHASKAEKHSGGHWGEEL